MHSKLSNKGLEGLLWFDQQRVDEFGAVLQLCHLLVSQSQYLADSLMSLIQLHQRLYYGGLLFICRFEVLFDCLDLFEYFMDLIFNECLISRMCFFELFVLCFDFYDFFFCFEVVGDLFLVDELVGS